MNSEKIITGEKIQQIANVYIGNHEDLYYNPIIASQPEKHLYINHIINEYDNPRIIFCYTHIIPELSNIIHFFKNPFILISHNSDYNINSSQSTQHILTCNKLIYWFSQNVCMFHVKLYMLPIGLANSMWSHGKLTAFDYPNINNLIQNKTKKTYFHFSIHTNKTVREICFNILKNTIEWLPNIEPTDNLLRLASYEFCICPEGNGVDCHRIWEALYLKVVPVMINSPFVTTLLRNNIPIVVLNSWDEYIIIEKDLQYSKFIFGNYDINNIIQKITSNDIQTHNLNQFPE